MDDFDSPVDLRDAPRSTERPLGWATGIIAVAGALLLLMNAASVAAWADEQTPGPVQAEAARLAHHWDDITIAMGLAAPRAAVKTIWEAAKAAGAVETEPLQDQR